MLWLPLTLLLGLHLYCWQQASVWRQASSPVHRLPAPPPPGGLVYQEDERHDPSERVPAESSDELETRDPGEGLAPSASPGDGEPPDDTRISIAVVPNDVTTFVYLNGGSLLGRAPLRDLPLPPGQHRLTLWAPSIRGRAVRAVKVAPGEHAVVMTALATVPNHPMSLVR